MAQKRFCDECGRELEFLESDAGHWEDIYECRGCEYTVYYNYGDTMGGAPPVTITKDRWKVAWFKEFTTVL